MAKLSGTKPILNLYGSSGVGKTTIGKEICHRWPRKHIFVDLREVTEMKDVYFHVMLQLDSTRTVIKYDDNPVIERLQKVLEEEQSDVLLLMDNVDQFSVGDDDVSKSMNSMFKGFLHRLLECKTIEGKAQLKVLLISRSRFRIEKNKKKKKEDAFSLHEAIEYKEIEALSTETSTEILQVACGVSSTKSNQMEKLVEMCKRKPLLLNGIAAILRQKIADAKTLLETIEEEMTGADSDDIPSAEEEDVKETEQWEGIDKGQLSCLRKMFFLLPSDTLRHSAVALSLFCRPFTVEAAAFVLDAETPDAIILLEGLRNSKLFSVDPDSMEAGNLVYDIHPLTRSFLRSVGSNVFKQVYTKAERRFSNLFMEKMKDLASMLDVDYMCVFEQFDLDKANFELALDISFKTDYLLVSTEFHRSTIMCYLFDAMLDEKQRRKIFKSWADVIVEDGKEGKNKCNVQRDGIF